MGFFTSEDKKKKMRDARKKQHVKTACFFSFEETNVIDRI